MIRRIRNYPALLWLGAVLVLSAGFLRFADRFLKLPAVEAFDLALLRRIAEFRSPLLTAFFVNWTALGSTTLISLHTIIVFAFLLSTADRTGASQLATASGGAVLLTELTKRWFERARPTVVPALVQTTGFSYPSGHSLAAAAMYVTIAMLVCRHLETSRQRALVYVLAAIVVGGVGVSRVYLGAHYASDVMSGIGLGTAWALMLAAFVSMRERRLKPKGRV